MARPRKNPTLSDQLRKAVKDSGYSGYKLSKDTHLDARIIYRFQRGEVVTSTAIDAIAKVLGVVLVSNFNSKGLPNERESEETQEPAGPA